MLRLRSSVLVAVMVSGLGGLGCSFDPGGFPLPEACGDGVLGPGEECDGLNLGDSTCGSLGLGPGALGCRADCLYDVTGCEGVPPLCGNGVLDGAEQCDGANLGGATCDSLGLGGGALQCRPNCAYDTSGCATSSVCGNQTIEGGEQCDDGNLLPCDGCSPVCVLEACGNGYRECAEECDDGNLTPGDGCDAQCRSEVVSGCGDGVVNGAEVCEPGQIASNCVAEGYSGGTLGCAADCLSYDTSACTQVDGGPCTDNAQCDGGTCYTEAGDGWPGGYCTRECFFGQGCGMDAVCIDLGTRERCYELCNSTAECRTGYFCRLDPFGQQDEVCRPRCESDAHCPDGGTCNPWTGLCDGPADPAEGDNGDGCGTGLPPCKGGCWGSPSGGYCVSPCALSTGVCPGDGVCTDLGDGADLGYCLDGCAGTSDCPRPGYDCVSNPFGAGTICWQP